MVKENRGKTEDFMQKEIQTDRQTDRDKRDMMIVGERKPWEDGIFHAERDTDRQTDRQTETKEI